MKSKSVLYGEQQTVAIPSYVRVRGALRTTSVALALVLLFMGAACQRRNVDASTPRKAAEAFVQALMRNDLTVAKSLAIGSDGQVAQMQLGFQMMQALDRLESAKAKRFKHDKVDLGGGNPLAETLAEVASAEERIEGDTAKLVRNSREIYTLKKSGSAWKVAIRGEEPTAADLSWPRTVIKSYRELAEKTERGQYKSEEELLADQAKVFEAAAAAAQGSPSPAAARQQQIAPPDSSTPKKAVEAFVDACMLNDFKLAAFLALGSEEQVKATKGLLRSLETYRRYKEAKAEFFEAKKSTIPPTEDRAVWSEEEGDATRLETHSFPGSWIRYKLEKVGDIWKVDLRQEDPNVLAMQSASEAYVKEMAEVTENIKKGHYKTVAEADRDLEAKKAARSTQVASTSQRPYRDAVAWAQDYRNAKFITRAEFLRRVGPVQLVVRQSADVSEAVPNLESIVRTAATGHGWTISDSPTDFQLVVDANLDRSKIKTTEYGQFGAREQEGYQMVYTASVKVGFMTKANCRRGDKFVQLDVYPCYVWNTYYGAMGDLVDFATAYAKAFREAVGGAFDAIAKISEADDTGDEAWKASLWPPAQNSEMYKNFVSPMKDDTGPSKRVFYGVTKFALLDIDLGEGAAREFNVDSLRQRWSTELNRNGQEIDPSSDLLIRHEVEMYELANDWGFAKATVAYVNMSYVRAYQRNVVFPFNGELRRATVWLWSDVNTAAALPKDKSDTARDLVNQSIRSAAREFDLRR